VSLNHKIERKNMMVKFKKATVIKKPGGSFSAVQTCLQCGKVISAKGATQKEALAKLKAARKEHRQYHESQIALPDNIILPP